MRKTILVIGASNSSRSINKQLAIWAADQLEGVDSTVLDLNDYEMPLFGIDREDTEGIPEKAIDFKTQLHKADGLILSLAEHNGSYAVAFKNVVDWASRLEGKLWPNTPMLLLSTSPGGRGAKTVMEAGMAYLPRAGANIAGSFSLPRFKENFNPSEGIVENNLRTGFANELNAFQAALNSTP